MTDSSLHSDTDRLAHKARRLTTLHVPGDPLVLPNAWDASSAWIIARSGASAIATSSAACAWSIGWADGDVMTRDEALGPIRSIASAVDVPVTADIETGYGAGEPGSSADDAALAETIDGVLTAGAVGVNIEDSGGDPLTPIDVAAHRISIARQAAERAGVPLHINARCDVFFAPVGDPDERLGMTLQRAAAYADAGASSIFVPGVRDLGVIREMTAGMAVPVNVLAGAGAPSVPELADAGVGRVSVGSSLNLAMLHALSETVTGMFATGSFDALGGIPYPEANGYFAGR